MKFRNLNLIWNELNYFEGKITNGIVYLGRNRAACFMLAQPLGLVAHLNGNRGAESGSPTAAGRQRWWGIPASRHRRWVGKRCFGWAAKWRTDTGGKGKRVLTGEAIHGGVGPRRETATVEVDHRPREPVRWTVGSTKWLRSSRRWRWGRRMAGVARPCGGAWRLMRNRRWKQGSVVEAAGG
jgi:hypothetical protein